jgi:hypothetical protein
MVLGTPAGPEVDLGRAVSPETREALILILQLGETRAGLKNGLARCNPIGRPETAGIFLWDRRDSRFFVRLS